MLYHYIYFIFFFFYFKIVISPPKKSQVFHLHWTITEKRQKFRSLWYHATCSTEIPNTVKKKNKAATLLYLPIQNSKGFSTAYSRDNRITPPHQCLFVRIRWTTAKSRDSLIPVSNSLSGLIEIFPCLRYLELFVKSSRSRNFSSPIILNSKPRKLCNLRFPANW